MESKKGYRAKVTGLPISPFKVRPLAALVRRKPVQEALDILTYQPNKGALFLRKVIDSAASNAISQEALLDRQSLLVEELLVDGGPTRKKIWPRARGRADRLAKRSTHISVVLRAKKEKGRG